MLHGNSSRSAPTLDRRVEAPRSATHRRRADGRHRQRAGRPLHPPITVRSQPPARTSLSVTGGAALVLPRAAILAVGPQRAAQFLTRGLAALIVLAVTGLIAYVIVADHRRGVAAAAADLRSRAVDPAPLTLPEVFGDSARVVPPGDAPAYRVTMTHIDGDCRIATTGTLGSLLTDHGCTQVVRASLAAPYGDYRVTAGLFNLADAAGAAEVDARLRALVETGDGGFGVMAAGEPGTDPATPPSSQVGWHSRGHYLLYCVITRPGGDIIPSDDPNAARITADLVDGYLSDNVLAGRAGA
jgi:hypothetical protein